ncbi:MAG: glycosyltransferase family 2 protein [Candidatus Nanopelagicaceae bacterium]
MAKVTSSAVSVILPVLNEENYLEAAVKAVLSQDFSGAIEILLAVGPSRDCTLEIANKLAATDKRVKVVDNPSGRTAAGLNLAIKNSSHPIIVRVDGHAKIPNNYISIAVQLLEETGAVNVGGVMAAEGETPFEKAVAGAMRSPLGVGAAKFHIGGSAGEADTVYLGVFKRSAINAIGGFDEHFTRAQDWELNFRLRKNGGKIYFDPRLIVTYRPRRSLFALSKHYFEYGRCLRVVSRTHKGTINLRYLAPPITLVGTILSLIGGLVNPLLYIPAGIYGTFLILASVKIGKTLKERFYLPAILLTMQMSWGAGFITSTRSFVR